jgi:glyoxylase-like metal-dependent hydrolase (beta-lactamase superfamily II)
MNIETIVMGDFQTNCYCVRKDEEATDCLLIDPGLTPEPLIQYLEQTGLTPSAIFLTHGHADHIGGVETVRQHWPGVEVAIHAADSAMLTNPTANLSVMAGCMVQTRTPELILDAGQDYYYAAEMQFKVLHTPGHTPGGTCLYSVSENVIFVGDTLFAGSIGRSDFPGGDGDQLIQMIREKLLVLPEETTVYPGHGPSTAIAYEKQSNPYVAMPGL